MEHPPNGLCATLLALLLSTVAAAQAPGASSVFYLSPAGDDSASGLTAGEAWQTWPHALAQLRPGDTLIVRNGTWAFGNYVEPNDPQPRLLNARMPYINCDPGFVEPALGLPYAAGRPCEPITVRAEHERGVLLRGNGARAAIEAIHCRHWHFEGLRGESADLPRDAGGYPRAVFQFHSCEDIHLRRMLGATDNRFFNNHIFQLAYCEDCVLTENEAYDFHRHGFSAVNSNRIEFTRCYAHSRDRADLAGGYDSHDIAEAFGDEGLVCYFSNDCLVQNCIVERSEGIQVTGDHNRVLGCIAIDGPFGFRFASNCQDAGVQACTFSSTNPRQDTYAEHNHGENLLAVQSSLAAIDCDSSGDTTIRHVTTIGTGLWSFVGRDRRSTEGYDTSFSIEFGLAIGNGGPVGFFCDGMVTSSWSGNHMNAFAHSLQNFGPGSATTPPYSNPHGAWNNASEIDPRLGANMVHVPAASPMWLPSGECIGATILYRYEGGALTTQPLWDPATGAFPHGTLVPGVNGPLDGRGIANVHRRLNVNANGGALPSWYP